MTSMAHGGDHITTAPPSRRSFRRRFVRRLVLASILALLTLITTAWVIPQFTGMPNIRAAGPSMPGTLWTDGVRGGSWIRRGGAHWESIDLRRIIFAGTVTELPYFALDDGELPAWAQRISLDMREGFEEVITIATGWPWRSLAWERWIVWNTPEPVHSFVIASDGSMSSVVTTPPAQVDRGAWSCAVGSRRVVLPYHLIWKGAIATLAFWWLLWAALLIAPWLITRILRHHENRCVDCGYPRTGHPVDAPCSECGYAMASGRGRQVVHRAG